MSYEYITKYNAKSFTKGREGHKIKEIVIHHWGVDGQTFEGVIDWFTNNAPTSAHFVVEAGRVACLVDLSDTAYHAGNWLHNLESIGIECRPEMSEEDFATLVELVRYLFSEVGKVRIVGHQDIVPTSCPGRYYARLPELRRLAESNKAEWKQNSKGWWYQKADGSYLKNEWQKINGTWYHFDAKGYMQTGWQEINNRWFYLGDNGAMKTGWLKYNGYWFYFDENGYMKTGWLKYNNYWFYFLDSGKMKTGWVAYRDEWYYMNEKDGKLVSNAYKEIGGKLYRFNSDGKMEKTAKYQTTKNGDIVKI